MSKHRSIACAIFVISCHAVMFTGCGVEPAAQITDQPSQTDSKLGRDSGATDQPIAEQATTSHSKLPETDSRSDKTDQDDEQQEKKTGEKYTQDSKTEKTEIVIKAEGGKVAWSDIADAVSKQLGVDIPILKTIRGRGDLDLEAPTARWAFTGINVALAPAIRLSVKRSKESVVVKIDHKELENLRKKYGVKLRSAITNVNGGAKYEIVEYDKQKKIKDARHLVIIVHGFNSDSSQLKTLADKIGESDFTAAFFHYPTRNGVEAAAKNFNDELKNIVEQNSACEISLVTHSMGGLLARKVVEADDFEMEQVKRLIMIAPPNGGSNLALLPIGGDSLETMFASIDRTKMRSLLRDLVAEVNTAVEDLRPGSKFLTELNSKKRNPDIQYSIIAGKTAVLTQSQADALNGFAEKLKKSSKTISRGGEEIDIVVKKLSGELVSPQGDGVVSVKNAKLEGVDDVVVLEFGHRDISIDRSKNQPKIIAEVLKRLQK